MKILVVMSTSRSGSTLLDRLIGDSFVGASLGEIHQIWARGYERNDACGCGQNFRGCDFWSEVTQRAGFSSQAEISAVLALQGRVVRNRTVPLAVHPNLASATWRRSLEDYRAVLGRLYEAVGAVSGLDLMIDSSKRPSHVAVVGKAVGGSTVAAVHLVRDSRAVAFSLGRHKRKTDSSEPEAMMQRMSAVAAARSWNRSNLLAEYVARNASTSVRIRYEDLVTDPGSAMDLVAGVLGTGFVPARPASGAELHLSVAHTVSGNPMRLTQGPVELRSDNEWVRAMDPVDRRAVTRRTWPMLRRYGY